MSKDESTSQCISSRGGALVLKSISIFLGNRGGAKAPDTNKAPKVDQKRAKRKRMSDKDCKCPSNVYEVVKRDTGFSR